MAGNGSRAGPSLTNISNIESNVEIKSRKGFKPKNSFSSGRKKNCKNKKTIFKEILAQSDIDEDALKSKREKLMKAMESFALKGDPTCIKLLHDMWFPVPPARKGARFPINIRTEVKNTDQLDEFRSEVLTLVSTGEISLEESQLLNNLTESKAKSLELIAVKELTEAIENDKNQE